MLYACHGHIRPLLRDPSVLDCKLDIFCNNIIVRLNPRLKISLQNVHVEAYASLLKQAWPPNHLQCLMVPGPYNTFGGKLIHPFKPPFEIHLLYRPVMVKDCTTAWHQPCTT